MPQGLEPVRFRRNSRSGGWIGWMTRTVLCSVSRFCRAVRGLPPPLAGSTFAKESSERAPPRWQQPMTERISALTKASISASRDRIVLSILRNKIVPICFPTKYSYRAVSNWNSDIRQASKQTHIRDSIYKPQLHKGCRPLRTCQTGTWDSWIFGRCIYKKAWLRLWI